MRIKKFILEDKGWRTNEQYNEKAKANTRMGRTERSNASKAIYRIFTRGPDFDCPYPFEQHIPQGQQNVPPMRGWRLVPSTVARVYYAAYREKYVLGNQRSENLIMNQILEKFCTPFVHYREENCSLAAKVLRQGAHTRDQAIEWPTHAERLALKYLEKKPENSTFKQWVEYWKNQGN